MNKFWELASTCLVYRHFFFFLLLFPTLFSKAFWIAGFHTEVNSPPVLQPVQTATT